MPAGAAWREISGIQGRFPGPSPGGRCLRSPLAPRDYLSRAVERWRLQWGFLNMLSFYGSLVPRKVSVCAKYVVDRATAGDDLWGGKYSDCRPYTILEA